MGAISHSIDDLEPNAATCCKNTDMLVVEPELPTPYPNRTTPPSRIGFPCAIREREISPHVGIIRRALPFLFRRFLSSSSFHR